MYGTIHNAAEQTQTGLAEPLDAQLHGEAKTRTGKKESSPAEKYAVGEKMTTIERAEEMRQNAIALLLEERSTINDKLAQLGFGTEEAKPTPPPKKRACSVCGGESHNAKTCPNRTEEAPPMLQAVS
jgi:hypothetical protein